MNKKRNMELKRAEHRKLEFERNKKKAKNMTIVSVILIAMICIVAYAVVSMSGNNDVIKESDTETPPLQSQTEVRISASEISNNAKFYEYDADSLAIRFFAVEAADGEIRVAFDACDVCYGAKKGYTQIGDVMHCINCGNQYAITGLGTENLYGGCWPSFLPMEFDGNDVIIQIEDLEDKKYMFA